MERQHLPTHTALLGPVLAAWRAWWRQPARYFRCDGCRQVIRRRLRADPDEHHDYGDCPTCPCAYRCGKWRRVVQRPRAWLVLFYDPTLGMELFDGPEAEAMARALYDTATREHVACWLIPEVEATR